MANILITASLLPFVSSMKEEILPLFRELLEEQMQTDREDFSGPRGSGPNRQQQVERLQKKAESIDKWLAENQPKQGAAGRENQSNITDNDSAKMMKRSLAKNSSRPDLDRFSKAFSTASL